MPEGIKCMQLTNCKKARYSRHQMKGKQQMKGWHQMHNHQIVRKPVMYGRHQMKRGQM